MATPLHNHSHFSALDGLSKPEEIAEAAIKNDFAAAGVSDHGLVAGHLEFWKAMDEKGLRPVLGMEAYQAPESRHIELQGDAFHLLLLAKNDVGLRNIWALSTDSHATGFYYKPRTDWELLERYAEGIICTSACLGGLVAQSILGPPDDAKEKKLEIFQSIPSPERLIQRYKNIFGDDFYIEIHTYDSEQQRMVNQALVDLARQTSTPLVYATDAHYAYREQYELHEAVLKLTQNAGRSAAKKEGRDKVHPPSLWIMGEPEIRAALDHLPQSAIDESIANSDLIAESCSYTPVERRSRVPRFDPEKGYENNRDMFVKLLEGAFQEKVIDWDKPTFPRDPDTYFARLAHEMEVIFSVPNMLDYFLIVRDFVNEARRTGAKVGPGRGSAGGSLVSYLLGITDVDPIYYELQFERFYNAGREKGLPDIDVDFDMASRDRIKNYVSKKYGPERVAEVGTVTRMGPKLALSDMGRVLDEVNFLDVKAMNKILDDSVESGLWNEWADIVEGEFGKQLEPYIKKYPKLIEFAVPLMGKNYGSYHTGYVKTYSVHASAVIVADEPLKYNFPLRWVADDKKLVSQWDMHAAEDLGFMKMDFLGLTQLSVFDELDVILKEQGREPIPWDDIQYMEHPEEMWQLLDKGLTVGIFQMDASGTAKKLLRDLKPRSVLDLSTHVAVNRPGPLIAGSDRRIIGARNGETVRYLNEFVQGATESEYGEFIYQEQVTKFLALIGYTLQEADTVRKNMGKKIRELMIKEKTRYMDYALKVMSKEHAEAIWDILEPFAKYAFNKSHSVQYGVITLQSLYAKFHYPAEYMLAGMRADEKKNRSKWINEAQRMGIEVLPPDINHADVEPTVKDGKIYLGLNTIKNIGKSHAKWVVDNRPYESYDDFVEKTREPERKYTTPNGQRKILVDIGRAGTLWDAGCFDSIEPRDIPKEKRIALEEELLTVALSDDSSNKLETYLSENGDPTVPMGAVRSPGPYVIAGVIREVKERKTKKGDPYAVVKIERDGEEFEFKAWQDDYRRYTKLLRVRTPVIAHINNDERGATLYRHRKEEKDRHVLLAVR